MDEVVGGARAAAPRQLSKASGHLLDDVDLLLSRTLDHEEEAVPCLLVPSCVPQKLRREVELLRSVQSSFQEVEAEIIPYSRF